MGLQSVKGGWVNDGVKAPLLSVERRSKYKVKVTIQGDHNRDAIHNWLYNTLGDGGRNKKLRWRFGWTGDRRTYYFKNEEDATMFVLRWS